MERQIFLKGKDCTRTIRSIKRLSSGKYEVYFANNSQRFEYLAANVKIIESALNNEERNSIFSYYRALASEIGLRSPDGKNILRTHYDKITFVSQETMLSAYLSGKINDLPIDTHNAAIFPFGCNMSQQMAVNNAMTNRLSIIQGPPGTGKTQTILNIIANVISENKTVAVVSNNNSAIDNVYEKLKEYDVDFIAAKLGSTNNKQNFVQSQQALNMAKLKSWVVDKSRLHNLYSKIQSITETINDINDKQIAVAKLKVEHDELVTERQHFAEYYENHYGTSVLPRFLSTVKSDKVLDVWRATNQQADEVKVIRKVYQYLRNGILINSFYKQPKTVRIAALQKVYYDRRIAELETAISEYDKQLSGKSVARSMRQYKDVSTDIFRAHIAKRYKEGRRVQVYELDDLWKRSGAFIEDYPVVLSTTYSLRSSLNKNHMYDYVIVDEASQVDAATFMLALSCAKNAVIVGDEKQLPNVITGDVARHDDHIFNRFSIDKKYKFSTHSALSMTMDLFGGYVPMQLLKEHYRCHPKIIGFCNKMYYGGELLVLADSEMQSEPLKIYETVKGNHARENRVNQRQIDVTLGEVVPREKLNLMDGSVGIVAPYRNHVEALAEQLRHTKTLAATVDKFQGRERDTIIINTVDNKIGDFVSNPNRLNVAVSRARKKLIVVTDGNDNSANTDIGELINYIRYSNGEVVSSKVYSIFDNLYTSYYRRRAKKARKGSSAAEDLMYELLESIYKDCGFSNLQTIMEYPLKMLVPTDNLEGRDAQYANNDLTRVDFVVFRKTSKQPLFAIEVDGHAFHNNAKQQERDEIKTRLLADAGVPLLRLATTASGERERIIKALRDLGV